MRVAGRRVNAATGGRPLEPGRPRLVLLHGAGLDHTVWSLVTPALADHGFSALAPDLPGHGDSEGPIPQTVQDYAEWAAALVEATGGGAAHLAGHSLGAAIALETAARHPELVDRLILLGTAAAMPVHPDLQSAADSGDPAAIDMILAWGLGPRARPDRDAEPAAGTAAARVRAAIDLVALASDLRTSNAHANAVAAAGAVGCPTLLILGDADKMTPPRNAEPLLETLGDPTAVTLPEIGHMMMLEDPAAVTEGMVGFLTST